MRINNQPDGEQLEEIIAKGVTLVNFNAPWCAPCRDQEVVIQALAGKFGNLANVIGLNVDDHRKFAIRLGIASIPTLVLFKDGREIKRFVGLQPSNILSKAIKAALR